MSKLFAAAFPILPGKEEQWEKFAGELKGARHEDFKKSRADLHVHERSFLQHTPHGSLVVVTLEGEDPMGAFASFAKSDDEFTAWFRQQVMEIHGFDLREPPPGPMPEMLLDSRS